MFPLAVRHQEGGLLTAQGHPRATYQRAIERGDLLVAEPGSTISRLSSALSSRSAGAATTPPTTALLDMAERASGERCRTGLRNAGSFRIKAVRGRFGL